MFIRFIKRRLRKGEGKVFSLKEVEPSMSRITLQDTVNSNITRQPMQVTFNDQNYTRHIAVTKGSGC